MTVKIIEQIQSDGTVKLFAYHAHIVYHGDPENDPDWNPSIENSVVEVMAELPNGSALATYRSPLPVEQALMGSGVPGSRSVNRVIDVICPDPNCMSITTYPWNGDPEARAVHARYAQDVSADQRDARMALDPSNSDHRQQMRDGRVGFHQPIQAYVANAWAREYNGLDAQSGHEHLERRDPEGVLEALDQMRRVEQEMAAGSSRPSFEMPIVVESTEYESR